jgi:hypothetical protein
MNVRSAVFFTGALLPLIPADLPSLLETIGRPDLRVSVPVINDVDGSLMFAEKKDHGWIPVGVTIEHDGKVETLGCGINIPCTRVELFTAAESILAKGTDDAKMLMGEFGWTSQTAIGKRFHDDVGDDQLKILTDACVAYQKAVADAKAAEDARIEAERVTAEKAKVAATPTNQNAPANPQGRK